jgi:phage terminase Nu1 subunit (DNA packaging protein)
MAKAAKKTVSREELAKIFRVTPRWINRLVTEHGMPQEAHGRFDLAGCLLWHMRYLQGIVARRDGGDDDAARELRLELRRERVRRERALADAAEMDNGERRGNLLSLDLYKATLGNAFATVRARLLLVPQRVGPQCEGDNRTVIAETVRKELYAAMRELALDTAYLEPGDCPTCGQAKPLSEGNREPKTEAVAHTAEEVGGDEQPAARAVGRNPAVAEADALSYAERRG